MGLHGRLTDFIGSLRDYPPTGRPAGAVVDIFNALREQVQSEYPNDPIAAVVPEAKKLHQSGNSAMDAGSMVAAAYQLLGAVEPPAPIIA